MDVEDAKGFDSLEPFQFPRIAKNSHASAVKNRDAKWLQQPTGPAWVVIATANESKIEPVTIDRWKRDWPILITQTGDEGTSSKAKLWFDKRDALLDLFVRKKRRSVSLHKQAQHVDKQANAAFDAFIKEFLASA